MIPAIKKRDIDKPKSWQQNILAMSEKDLQGKSFPSYFWIINLSRFDHLFLFNLSYCLEERNHIYK